MAGSIWILSLVAAVASAPADPQVLRVGLDPRDAPGAFVAGLEPQRNDLGKAPVLTAAQLDRVEGFDVDVMKALSRRLGLVPRIVPTDWYDLEEALVAGRIDVIIGSWTPSEGTPQEVAASLPYYDWGLVVAVRAGDTRIQSLKDLGGLKIGQIQDPSVTKPIIQMGRELGAELTMSRDNAEYLFEDLKQGAVDAVVLDSPYVLWRISKDPGLFRLLGSPLNRLGYHVGVRRSDPGLLERVNGAIRSLLASEEIGDIRRRWSGGQ